MLGLDWQEWITFLKGSVLVFGVSGYAAYAANMVGCLTLLVLCLRTLTRCSSRFASGFVVLAVLVHGAAVFGLGQYRHDQPMQLTERETQQHMQATERQMQQHMQEATRQTEGDLLPVERKMQQLLEQLSRRAEQRP